MSAPPPSPTEHFYSLGDHLGSVRATANEAGTLVHVDDYYPFGMPMPGRNNVEGEEGEAEGKPRYTGHEQEVDIDPDAKAVYYAGARYYDGLLGKWNAVDPLGQYASPYTYVGNDPMGIVDPSGLTGVDASEANRLDCSTSHCGTTYSFSGFVGSGFVDDPDPTYVGSLGEVVVTAKGPGWLGRQINKALDGIQTGLDVLGLIPLLGIVPDLVNAGISGGRVLGAVITSDWKGAGVHLLNGGLSLGAAVPGIGLGVGAGKVLAAGAGVGALGFAAARRARRLKQLPAAQAFDLGEGRIFNHFTDAKGVRGITGIVGEGLDVGQTVGVSQLRFARGWNPQFASSPGSIFVTELGPRASIGQLNRIGVFGPRQGFAIGFSEGTAFSQGIRVLGTMPSRGIFTIPGGSILNGTFTVTRLR